MARAVREPPRDQAVVDLVLVAPHRVRRSRTDDRGPVLDGEVRPLPRPFPDVDLVGVGVQDAPGELRVIVGQGATGTVVTGAAQADEPQPRVGGGDVVELVLQRGDGAVPAHQPLEAVGRVHDEQETGPGRLHVLQAGVERPASVGRRRVAIGGDGQPGEAGLPTSDEGHQWQVAVHLDTRKSGSSAETPAICSVASSASTTSFGVIEVADACAGFSTGFAVRCGLVGFGVGTNGAGSGRSWPGCATSSPPATTVTRAATEASATERPARRSRRPATRSRDSNAGGRTSPTEAAELLEVRHCALLLLRVGMRSSSSSASRVRPRESRDFTVPTGIPSSAAMSSDAEVGQVVENDDDPLVALELCECRDQRNVVGADLHCDLGSGHLAYFRTTTACRQPAGTLLTATFRTQASGFSTSSELATLADRRHERVLDRVLGHVVRSPHSAKTCMTSRPYDATYSSLRASSGSVVPHAAHLRPPVDHTYSARTAGRVPSVGPVDARAGRRGANLRADDEIRTRDIDLGKVALYQLSYIRSAPRRCAAQMLLDGTEGPAGEG